MNAGDMISANIRLVRKLGEGGMGAVWVAHNDALDAEVAVKFIVGEYAQDDLIRARFKQEASLAAKVKSPHIVQVFDHGVTEDGTLYIVMELLSGEELADRLEKMAFLPREMVVAIITQAAKGLARAHAAGVIHRDIKPANIFLSDQEEGEVFVKIVDFGIAKIDQNKAATSMTSTGTTVGTPHYMSPEQIFEARKIDMRTDLWSLAVVAYKCLTGSMPFDGESLAEVWRSIDLAVFELPSQHRPSLPLSLDAWFIRAFKRERDDRFQSAREFADALRLALPDVPRKGSAVALSAADESEQFPVVSVPPGADLCADGVLPQEGSTKVLHTAEERGETSLPADALSASALPAEGLAVAGLAAAELATGHGVTGHAATGESGPWVPNTGGAGAAFGERESTPTPLSLPASASTNLKRGLAAGALLLGLGGTVAFFVHSANTSQPGGGAPTVASTVGVGNVGVGNVGVGPSGVPATATTPSTGLSIPEVPVSAIVAAPTNSATASTRPSVGVPSVGGPLVRVPSGRPTATASTAAARPTGTIAGGKDHGF